MHPKLKDCIDNLPSPHTSMRNSPVRIHVLQCGTSN